MSTGSILLPATSNPNALLKDGTVLPTASFSWNGYQITNLSGLTSNSGDITVGDGTNFPAYAPVLNMNGSANAVAIIKVNGFGFVFANKNYGGGGNVGLACPDGSGGTFATLQANSQWGGFCFQGNYCDVFWQNDNTSDIGYARGVGQGRPRDVYIARDLYLTGQKVTGVTTYTPSGTTQTIDCNAGNTFILDLSSATGTVAITLTNFAAGKSIDVFVKMGGIAKQTTFTGVKWGGGNAYGSGSNFTNASNAIDRFTIKSDGVNLYGDFKLAYA